MHASCPVSFQSSFTMFLVCFHISALVASPRDAPMDVAEVTPCTPRAVDDAMISKCDATFCAGGGATINGSAAAARMDALLARCSPSGDKPTRFCKCDSCTFCPAVVAELTRTTEPRNDGCMWIGDSGRSRLVDFSPAQFTVELRLTQLPRYERDALSPEDERQVLLLDWTRPVELRRVMGASSVSHQYVGLEPTTTVLELPRFVGFGFQARTCAPDGSPLKSHSRP